MRWYKNDDPRTRLVIVKNLQGDWLTAETVWESDIQLRSFVIGSGKIHQTWPEALAFAERWKAYR